ncbi:MAG: NUDIX hydrolase [Leptolyngbyaceae cyanobacterium RU_5_1]|nr:NUDIX hydrolase [Leptolyngbyaceae cyanobacterium RU_5_1]
MQQSNRIRVIALGLIQDGDRLFVHGGYDSHKQSNFYRALGGGVEFGETSLEALQREFQEEVQAELTNIQYLGCIENVFTYNGKPGHELIQLYRCDFADPKFYQLEQVTYFNGGGEPIVAQWIERDRIKSGALRLVPEECVKYL